MKKETFLTFLILSIFFSTAQAQGGWTTFNTSPKPNQMGSTLSGTKGYYAGFSGLGTNYAHLPGKDYQNISLEGDKAVPHSFFPSFAALFSIFLK
jgi:hypothetical protein